MDLRRIALGGLVALPLTVGGGAVALQLFGPGLVRARVEEMASERLGLAAKVGEVSVGLGSVSVRDLVVGDGAQGARLTTRSVEVDGSPLLAWLRGPRAFDAIRVEGVDVELLAGSAGVRALRERFAQARAAASAAPSSTGAAPSSAGGAAELPRVEVRDLALRLADARGPLLALGGGTTSFTNGKLELGASEVRVGGAESHRLTLQGCQATLHRVEGGLALESGHVTTARVELAPDPRPNPAPDDDSESDLPAQAQEPAEPGLLSRLMDAWTGPALPQGTPPPDAARVSDAGKARRLRLDQLRGFVLEGGTVMGSGGPLLDGLVLKASSVDAGALRVEGSGRGGRVGKLRWDMRVWPAELRADGEVSLDALPLALLAPLLPSIPWHEPERSTVTASVVVKAESVHSLALTGHAELRDAAIASDRVAPVPVTGIDLSVAGTGRWLPLQRRLEVDSAKLTLREAAVDLTGAVEWASDHYLFALDATLPAMPCTAAIRALPADLLADMAQVELSGSIGGKLHLLVDSRQLQQGELTFDIQDRCEFVAVPVMADLRRFKMPFVHSVVEPDGSLFEMDTGPGTAKWTYLDDISPFLVHAVLAHEDAQFFTHSGFSPGHIRDALMRNLQEGRYVVGASTITMQLVKNIFLRREKTLARKVQEVLLTWWIERVMDKHEVLELYLNVIEYGPGVYGIRDGARHYFNRLPSELSPAEAVYLSTILPNPKRYHAAFERGSLSPGWLDKMRKIFKRLRERSRFDAQAADYGLQELEHFKFVPEGTLVPARHVVGSTAPLPYELGADQRWEGWPSDMEGEPAPDAWDDGGFDAQP